MTDARRQSPAAARNRQAILEILQGLLPPRARILELASGSGEHALHCTLAMPEWTWQPSDINSDALASINAWRQHGGPDNLRAPLAFDVAGDPWPAGPFDAMVAINLIHIASWEVAEALLTGAGQCLHERGRLILYGPFMREGRHTAPSNAAFDAQLQSRDPRWGLRNLEAVVTAAQAHGLPLERVVEMPANNLTVLFRRP